MNSPSISGRKTSAIWTVRILEHFRTFGTDGTSGRVLLEDTFGADLSQTGKAETFFKNTEQYSISGRKTSAIRTVRILEHFQTFGMDGTSSRVLLEDTFGDDLSQTGKAETFLKTVNSPASLEENFSNPDSPVEL